MKETDLTEKNEKVVRYMINKKFQIEFTVEETLHRGN